MLALNSRSQAKTDFTATYRLLDDCMLGEGAYASVFLAEHLKVTTVK